MESCGREAMRCAQAAEAREPSHDAWLPVLAACPLAVGVQQLPRWAVVPWYRVEALSDGSSHCRQVAAGPRQYLMTLVPHQLACLHPGHCQLDHLPT